MVRTALPFQSSVETPGGLGGPGQPDIEVRSFDASGRGYDLTPFVEGLQWSSVNPGGDETCSFRLARSWFAGAPEVTKGNRLEVQAGPDVLWRGRIEEGEGTVDQAELIGVTAYGTGIVLRDSNLTEIYVDSELAAWIKAPSLSRQLALTPNPTSSGTTFESGSSSNEVAPDDSGTPAVIQSQSRIDSDGATNPGRRTLAETWYDAAGIPIGAVYHETSTYDRAGGGGALGVGWINRLLISDNDVTTVAGVEADVRNVLVDTSGYFVAGAETRVFAALQMWHDNANTLDGLWKSLWKKLRVYGRHSLVRQGSDPGGFLGSQVVGDIVGRVAGVTARRIDSSTYIIEDIKFKQPTPHEEAVKEASRFDDVDWGTWGPDTYLERSATGYFDWKLRQPNVPHWQIFRADCESLNINTELSALFNAVDVFWTDTAGSQHVTRRTATVPELDDANPPITHVGRVDGGLRSQAGAEKLGDAFLALVGTRAPARGDVVIVKQAHHKDRGHMAPWYMRADGSNLKIPDVLPSRELFALSREPDRRSTFPIRRVSVDCSGALPRVSVSVDQAVDLMSQLQARLGAVSDVVGQG